MSNKKETPAIWDGLSIGIVVLAVLVLFVVGLTRWHKNDVGEGIALPETISGGFVPADVTSSWDPLVSAQKIEQTQVGQQVSSAQSLKTSDSADGSAALGVATAQRAYVSPAGNILIVQAARGSGQAWFPGSGGTYSTQGDALCYTASDSSEVTCRRTSNDLTVVLEALTAGGSAIDAATAGAKTDEVFDHISKRRF